MARMRRTQIYLEPELSDALDRVARKSGTTKADVIRRAAWRFLEQEGLPEEDPILGVIGLGEGAPSRVSEDHDQILADHALNSRPA